MQVHAEIKLTSAHSSVESLDEGTRFFVEEVVERARDDERVDSIGFAGEVVDS